MISESKVLVVDLDGTLCPIKGKGETYQDLAPEPSLANRIRQFAEDGWRIIIHSSRGMRTHRGNEGEICANVLPVVVEWLRRHDIPHHEVRMGKPWPGHDGFYIDDRAVRPREFLEHDLEALGALCARDRVAGAE